ncbi:hypothetical protein C8R43DRAFT_945985 [Mycena crocata]|nr:hypothetical protein C8R43DRAFT_945985 [Mycena crocata]
MCGLRMRFGRDDSEPADVVKRTLLHRILGRKKARKDTDVLESGQNTSREWQNSTENIAQHPDMEDPPSEPPAELALTVGVKDSIVSNLSGVLDVVQQVGKILESGGAQADGSVIENAEIDPHDAETESQRAPT